MAMRIPWDEQEALLLFDAYEVIQKNREKKNALTTALSINLRRRAADQGRTIDATFRNYAGISMRLSEIEKILHPNNSGLTKTSELFRSIAELYIRHKRTFNKRVQEIEEYRVKILADSVGFDLLESIVLLDAYLGIGAPGETKAHTARLVSAKLRKLAINRGCVISETFRSDGGVAGRLKKMEHAFQNMTSGVADVPQIFVEAVKVYYENRSEYKRVLKHANSIIGKVILPEDAAKLEKAKQQAKDAAPVIKTKYVKTKKDRKLQDTYPKEFVAIYKALEKRCFVNPNGVNATDLFLEMKKKHQRKVVIEILEGASWAKQIQTGKYVHVLGASVMAIQESNQAKFFTWLKTKATKEQCQEMQQATSMVSQLLMQRKVIKKPLFVIENADEVANVVNRVSSCFASSKARRIALRIVTLYATYLEEKTNKSIQPEQPQTLHEVIGKNNSGRVFSLHVDDKVYTDESPTMVFVRFCEDLSITYPLKIRTLVDIRIHGKVDIPLKRTNDGTRTKLSNVNAYVDNTISMQHAEDYTRWVCRMCGVKIPNISVCVEYITPVVPHTPQTDPNADFKSEDNPESVAPKPTVSPALSAAKESAIAMNCSPIATQPLKTKKNPLLGKMEQIVLRADMDGMSYDDLKDTMQITMVLTKQLVAQSVKIVDIKGTLIHEEAFIDWEDGADTLEDIIDKLMQKNNGYISSAQLFEYARIEMNMFLNDNDMREERAVYDMAQHLFEKVHYHGKVFSFRGKMHISRTDAGIGSNLDIYKKYAADQGGVFSLNGLIEYLESIDVSAGNLRNQMRMWTEPIFFFYDDDVIATAEALHIDREWKKAVTESLKVLFDDVGDHMILRSIPSIWFDQLPAISGNRPWTPLLLQSVLRFYSKELGARTIQALESQSLETLHTMIVANDSPIQNFGDVIISYLLEQNIDRRKYEAEELRSLLVDGDIIHGNELIWNMPKALKKDGRFAWDASGNQVAITI